MEITLPHLFQPRPYQIPVLRALDEGCTRAFLLWHRRAGKDFTLFNLMIKKAFERVGLYYYLLPTYAQSKKTIWDGITNDGLRFLDCIPRQIIKQMNSQEMRVELCNGSILQLIGTDMYDRLRGTNPVGCVFSEFAFQNPMAWEVIKPILTLNGGWAVFVTTPNGKNFAHQIFEMARKNDDWFTEKLTIYDTGLLNESDLDRERKEGMSEEMLGQEYMCSFSVGALGSFYARYVEDAEKESRITSVPYEKGKEVNLYLDLGKSDSTAIIFAQEVGKEIRIIDSLEDHGKDIGDYATILKAKPYLYGAMYLPHDATHKRLESQKTVEEQFRDLGFKTKIVPNLSVQNGIQLVRKYFPRFWFDGEKTKPLVLALENYHREYDDKTKSFKQDPLHDWSSHFADAIRYMCTAWEDSSNKFQSPQNLLGSNHFLFNKR